MAEALSGVGLPEVLYCFRTETDSRTMAQKDAVIVPTGESFSAMWTYFLYHKTLITIFSICTSLNATKVGIFFQIDKDVWQSDIRQSILFYLFKYYY